MKNIFAPVILVLILILAACGDSAVNVSHSEHSPSPSILATPAQMVTAPADKANVGEVDNSTRAIAIHPEGRLLVKPVSKANAASLGAPSCYGLESDLRWTGDYEVIWEPASGEAPVKVIKFPPDFEIIQQNDSPSTMQHFNFEKVDIFAYVPRYTDCHGLETYLFGISDQKVFPISFEINAGEIWTTISQLPHHALQAVNEELIVAGGYGAGQDFINIYHFRYDPKRNIMVNNHTDQVKPKDMDKILKTEPDK